MTEARTIRVALAQLAPVWLHKEKTIQKIQAYIVQAATKNADLVVFGEGLLPGYPFWVSMTHGADFNSQVQKEIHAHYMRTAVDVEAGDLESICALAKEQAIAVYLGIIERPADRGGHSLYCSLVYIDKMGVIQSVHRKLQPTYEERLTWSPGDGHGLVVHGLNGFTLGGLNCWENWMPLSRTALYGLGENLHIAVWPGAKRNTIDITRFIAQEGRSYVISVSGLMRRTDFPSDTPHLDLILENAPDLIADGGSCIAAPDGSWLIEPQVGAEAVYVADLDLAKVYEERHNFDVAGHYARPDVTQLEVNRARKGILK